MTANEKKTVMKTCETPTDQIENIFAFFNKPANLPLLQVASDKTMYVWQHMSGFQYTQQVLRDGPIHKLPERLDPAIGGIKVDFTDGSMKTVDEYFDSSTMDGLLIMHAGDILYERYKTMRPIDKHNWFSCSKTIVGTSLALLEHEGKVDVSQPVPLYFPELAGSVWDTVTVEETIDMATGLDSTEHEIPDARTNPARGWFKWAVSIGVFSGDDTQSPIDVLRGMKRTKPGHAVFEYNSINTYVCQMIVEKIAKMPIAEFYGERVWRKIGAQNDGYLGVNKQGHANCFGFMNSVLRDLGRYGMVYTPSSTKLSEQPIIPPDVMKKFETGLRPEMYAKGAFGGPVQEAFSKVPGLANRYQWDIVTPDGDLCKLGVGGQGLYVSPKHDCVVVFFSTGTQVDENKGAWLARTVTQTFGTN